jgi:hypothetical protein
VARMRVAVVVFLVASACIALSGPSAGQAGCHPSYPGQCIPGPPPNLNCDSPQVQFSNFPVLPPDPHGLDGNDNDGIGCETSNKPRLVTTTTVSTATTAAPPGPPTTQPQTRILSITEPPLMNLPTGLLDRTG